MVMGHVLILFRIDWLLSGASTLDSPSEVPNLTPGTPAKEKDHEFSRHKLR